MKSTLRQKLLIAVGIFAGLLASMNLFAQAPAQQHQSQFVITSQADYVGAIESIEVLAVTLQNAHASYPQLAYTHIYNMDGSLMGFNVTGVPEAAQADKISVCLMQLEKLGAAVSNMDIAFLPDSKDSKLSSRVSKKEALKTTAPDEETTAFVPNTTSTELMASRK
jgi:hypothetical protein